MTPALRLAYETASAPADPSGDTTASAPVIVFIGSLGSSRSMWDPQRAALSSWARVVTVDLPGHGESPVAPGPYSLPGMASGLADVLDELGVECAHLVGLSLGGAVAQQLAISHPDRVRSLTLLCTAARFNGAETYRERAAAVRRDGTAPLAESVVDRWFSPGLAERDPELIARCRAMVADTPDEGYAGCCEALADFDSRADLARITAPTLVIAGADDPATPPSLMRELADGIAGATFTVVEPGAHLASVEQAGRVSRLIREHVARPTLYAPGRAAAHAAGDAVRRSVLGDAHVDRSAAGVTAFTEPFVDFITRTAWGDIWSRPGLDHVQRRLLTIAILTAVGNEHELDMHIRAALRAGVDADTIGEVLLHTAVYAGVPNSNRAFALGKQALADLDTEASA